MLKYYIINTGQEIALAQISEAGILKELEFLESIGASKKEISYDIYLFIKEFMTKDNEYKDATYHKIMDI